MKLPLLFCIICLIIKSNSERKVPHSRRSNVEKPEEEIIDQISRPIFIPAYMIYRPVIVITVQSGSLANSLTASAYHLGKIIRHALAITNHRTHDDDIPFNLQIIDTIINKNYENALSFKEKIHEEHPEFKKVFEVSKHGFKCDEHFCKRFGEGRHAFGICTTYSCSCTEGVAEEQQCRGSLIFDPVYDDCDVPTKIKICGL